MKQYWMKIKYGASAAENCTYEGSWELTRGKFTSENAVLKAYEARMLSLGGTILEVKPHEQFEFNYDKEPATGCDYGIAG